MKNIILFLLCMPIVIFSQEITDPIIDVHVHGYTERTYRVIYGSPPDFKSFKEEMRKQFQKNNIVFAVKSGGEFDEDMEKIMLKGYESNNFPKFDTIQFKKHIAEKKIQVWGEFMPMFNGLTLADDSFAPYLKICEREGIPIALHAGSGPPQIYKRYPNFRLALGDPLLIESVLIEYPKLKIYLMHAGIPFHDNTLALMETYPQVYVDLGAILFLQRPMTQKMAEDFLRKAKEYDMIDRLMFGSDCMYWPDELENSINKLKSYDFLSEEDKRKIFYENAVRFFELDHLKK